MNSNTDFDLKDNFIKTLDLVASYWGAINNIDNPLYWIERPYGEKEYEVKFAYSSKGQVFDYSEILKECPEIVSWVEKNNLSEGFLNHGIQDFVLDQIKNSNWNAVLDPERKVVKCANKRPPSQHWSYNDFFRKKYWTRLTQENKGRNVDKWAYEIKSILKSERNKEKQDIVIKKLRKIMMYQPSWEETSGQSFRAWAKNNPSWNKFLDIMSISYIAEQDGLKLPIWALQNKWIEGCLKWCEEKNVSFGYVPNSIETPETWKIGEFDKGSLWHWSIMHLNKHDIAKILKKDPSLINSTDPNGRTALHWACAIPKEDVVDFLLSQGASLNIEDNDKKIPCEYIPENYDNMFNRLENMRILNKCDNNITSNP